LEALAHPDLPRGRNAAPGQRTDLKPPRWVTAPLNDGIIAAEPA